MSMQVQNSGQTNINDIKELYSSTLQALTESLQKLQTNGLPQTSRARQTANSDLPTLIQPVRGGLSLETLLDSIGFEQRKVNCKAGLESLEAKAAEQKEINDKELEELGKQLEKMKKQKVLNIFKKIFSAIGAIVGAIASAATIALGAATGNPLLIAAGTIGMVMALDSTLSVATDGKVSLARGFTELGKACGMDDETANYFALEMQILMAAVTITLSLGAGFSNTVSSAANLSNVTNVLSGVQKGLTVTNAVVTVGTGAATIASSVIQYQVDTSKAKQKELEAILERIRQACEMEKDLIEAEMRRSDELLGQVKDIVDNTNKTQQSILTGTPSFA